MQRKKKLILCIIIFLLVIVSLHFLINFWSKTEIGSRFIFASDYKQMEKVANDLCALDDDSVYILKPFGQIVTGPREFKDIKDFKIKFFVFLLFAKGYDAIDKNNQTVYFQRWYDGFERYRGYAFSCDGSGELMIDYLVDQKEMSQANWYLYYEDYNKWRAINR